MKKGWTTKCIGEIATIKPPKSEARERIAADALVSFLPMEDLGIAIKYPEPKQSKRLSDVVGSYTYFAEGDVLLAKITPCFENGKLGIAKGLKNGIGFGSSEFIVIRPDSTVSNEWLFHFLSREDFRNEGAQRMGGAVGQQRVPKEFVESYEIPVPPLAEQQRIVGVLDEAFAGLATAQAHAAQNLQNARALFESHLQSVFTHRGKGWVEKTLGELCQIKTGKKDVNQGNPEGQYPFFTCAAEHTYSDVYSFDTEALLVAGNGNVGQVSYYSGKFEAYQRTYVLFGFKGVTAKYLFRVLDKRLSATVGKQKLGNTMPYIKIGMLTYFPVPIPPGDEQARVTAHLDALAAETQRLTRLYEQKQAALAALKKSLLHQAFTGEL
jgi:type I restriction enzyme S subunit